MSTGFYRVSIVNNNNGQYYQYQIRNKLVKKEIIRKDIYELKEEVENAGLLWGIIDIDIADKHKGQYRLKTLQGQYGKKIGD